MPSIDACTAGGWHAIIAVVVRCAHLASVSAVPDYALPPAVAFLSAACLDRTISTIAGGAAECDGNLGGEGVQAV